MASRPLRSPLEVLATTDLSEPRRSAGTKGLRSPLESWQRRTRDELVARRSGIWCDEMKKAIFCFVVAIGLMAASVTTYDAARPPAELQPAWTEFIWPFPVDQWGIGRAFVCKAAECGVEVNLYVRPKIGFCKCATGVDDDDELERVGDNALIGTNTAALGPGRLIEVAWMKGRSRTYGVMNAAQGRVLSIGFN